MREKIGKITLDDTCYSGSDLYSDGPVEEELLEVAKSCHTPEEYNQVIAERKSWPVMYHFSHIRGNIVSWLPITKEDKVLEIGAGCGAITGALAKKAGSVTCVELSRQRSLVKAYRNEDCDNVTTFWEPLRRWKRRWRRSTVNSPSSASSSRRPAIRTTRTL